MNAKPHSPEWLIANADHGVAFERACASAMERLLTENAELQQQLEAIGAGGVGPLMPSKLTVQDIADSALLGNIESPFNACMHQEHCKQWKKEAEAERQFSARDDAERLKSVARGMSYNDHSEAVWKHTLMEIAIRLETGGYAAFRATPELAQAQSGGISPDWKPVPVVPTEKMLDAGRNACEGRFYPQDMLHGPRAMMADRWVAMLDAAPQPPTTEQSSAVERPQGERHPGVLMPSRSLVDQVIREIARYCNTGEMDDAESLLANLQVSIDPAQQPPQDEPAPLELKA